MTRCSPWIHGLETAADYRNQKTKESYLSKITGNVKLKSAKIGPEDERSPSLLTGRVGVGVVVTISVALEKEEE
jgi:hypothetical protein